MEVLQVRQAQSSEKASMKTERLAVLALASQVAAGQPGQEARLVSAPMGYWNKPTHSVSDGSIGPASPASIEQMLSVSPNLVNMTNRAKSTDGNRVLGAALPGLLAINATSAVLNKYCKLRDSIFTTGAQARASDAACAGIIYVLATVMF